MDTEDVASDSFTVTAQARQHRSHILANARIATAEHRAELAERRAEKAEAELAALVQAKATNVDSKTAIITNTEDKIDIARGISRQLLDQADASAGAASKSATTTVGSCPACPPCDDCPPCPVSYCDWEDEEPCTFPGQLSKTFSWEGTQRT